MFALLAVCLHCLQLLSGLLSDLLRLAPTQHRIIIVIRTVTIPAAAITAAAATTTTAATTAAAAYQRGEAVAGIADGMVRYGILIVHRILSRPILK